MAKTLLNVNETLLSRAQVLLRQRTKSDTVNEALRLVLAGETHDDLLLMLASMDPDQTEALQQVREVAW